MQQVVEGIYRGEAGDAITLVHSDGTLDNLIRVFLSGFHVVKLLIEFVEIHLDQGTAGELHTLLATSVHSASGVVLTTNLVLVGLDELSDHVPEQVHLVGGTEGHSWAQVFNFIIGLSLLFLDLLDNLRHTMFNMDEENL